jgi:hypothetical protein
MASSSRNYKRALEAVGEFLPPGLSLCALCGEILSDQRKSVLAALTDFSHPSPSSRNMFRRIWQSMVKYA